MVARWGSRSGDLMFMKIDDVQFINGFLNTGSVHYYSIIDHRNSSAIIYPDRSFTIIDYFDEGGINPSSKAPGVCTCDLYTVIMVTGCKCGGK